MNLNKIFGIGRAMVYGLSTVIAIAVMILGAYVTKFLALDITSTVYILLGMITASFTILFLPFMLWVSITRKGAFPSMVAIELICTFTLWIMWLNTGATGVTNLWSRSCFTIYQNSSSGWAVCRAAHVLSILALFNWGLVFLFNVVFLILVIRLHIRGNIYVWGDYVTEVDYCAAPDTQNSGVSDEKASTDSHAPMMAESVLRYSYNAKLPPAHQNPSLIVLH